MLLIMGDTGFISAAVGTRGTIIIHEHLHQHRRNNDISLTTMLAVMIV